MVFKKVLGPGVCEFRVFDFWMIRVFDTRCAGSPEDLVLVKILDVFVL